LSPPGAPSYNGYVEAGAGDIETSAHYEAARHDRPGEGMCHYVRLVGLLADRTHSPGGRLGYTGGLSVAKIGTLR